MNDNKPNTNITNITIVDLTIINLDDLDGKNVVVIQSLGVTNCCLVGILQN